MNRLEALYAQYVRASSLTNIREIADIGADHGYLSRKILCSGFKGKIIITDIAEMPLSVAKKNIGIDPRVEYRQCDGLQSDFSKTDLIIIAGMGGDLIADMIRSAEGLREDVLFVVQPMTNFEKALSAISDWYLYSYFANEKEKHYRILAASKSRKFICEGDSIRIPQLLDFDENISDIAVQTANSSEIILRENLADAADFFRYKLVQAKKITGSVKGIAHLSDISIKRERQIEEILNLLETEVL